VSTITIPKGDVIILYGTDAFSGFMKGEQNEFYRSFTFNASTTGAGFALAAQALIGRPSSASEMNLRRWISDRDIRL
jgi:hypothetical protein